MTMSQKCSPFQSIRQKPAWSSSRRRTSLMSCWSQQFVKMLVFLLIPSSH
ncbi:unnamed protein product, partial [Darwinula stevensoni]